LWLLSQRHTKHGGKSAISLQAVGLNLPTLNASKLVLRVRLTRSRIDWSTVGVQSIRDLFLSLYPKFVTETKFENKCRLLLDLFKLQIVFAGAFYDCTS
jgi:hypothetical protein